MGFMLWGLKVSMLVEAPQSARSDANLAILPLHMPFSDSPKVGQTVQ